MSKTKASIWATVVVLYIAGVLVVDYLGYRDVVFFILSAGFFVLLWFGLREIFIELFD